MLGQNGTSPILAVGYEFDDIDAALPAFIFGNKRLRFVKPLG
jgi:hypothetical protein